MTAQRVEFNETDRSAILPIYRPSLVDALSVTALADGFEEKEEFHVTLLPSVDDPSQLNPEEIAKIGRILDDAPISEISYRKDTVARINKPKVVDGVIYPRESIITRVHSNEILRLLGRVPTAYGIELPFPFLHVTLFTKGDNPYARRGIGIDTREEYLRLKPTPYPDPDAHLRHLQ